MPSTGCPAPRASRFGGVRAADHLRTVLSRIGAKVAPSGSSVPVAHQSLGERVDPAVAVELTNLLAQCLDQLAEPTDAGLAMAS